MKITTKQLRALIKEELLNESVSRHCAFYLASDDNWYMELANKEYGEYEDATTYGPFSTLEDAEQYLHANFSNPGGSYDDDSGKQPPPTSSPNGQNVKRPGRSHGRGFMRYNNYF